MAVAASQTDVLVVDDNVLVCHSLARLLCLSGFPSRCVETGQEALDFLKTCRPTIVLLDVMMPDVNGFDVLQAIRADERCANVVVLMYSAVSDPVFRARAKELGANDYIIKGDLSFAQIKQLVADHLERVKKTFQQGG
ncbi:MAG TPA: response regulator [Tepidisphaeraceae bacterium]|jgi:PleD family two-component response regulator